MSAPLAAIGMLWGESNPMPGSWLTTASRPIRGADGALEGVIAAAVEAPYFEQLWRGIDLGAEGAVALFRRDGVLMMRSPHDEQSVGKVFTSLPLFTEHLERITRFLRLA